MINSYIIKYIKQERWQYKQKGDLRLYVSLARILWKAERKVRVINRWAYPYPNNIKKHRHEKLWERKSNYDTTMQRMDKKFRRTGC